MTMQNTNKRMVIGMMIILLNLSIPALINAQKKGISPQKLNNSITAEYLLMNLTKQSPRLVLNKKLEQNLKKKLKSDPIIQNVYQAIKLNAEHVFDESIINLNTPMEERSQNNQLDISREMLHRMSLLGMVTL
ncbi:MAG: hypothetical protein ACI959_001593 [Limisphaerales bacterium]|jgi:hypothetical protein